MARSPSKTGLGRPPERWIPLAVGVVAGLFSVGGVGALLVQGCSARPLPPGVGINCAEEAPYIIDEIEDYDTANYGWYAYGDSTPGAVMTTGTDGGASTVDPNGSLDDSFTAVIEGGDGGLCGRQRALFLQAHGYEDYGCGWGTYSIGGYPGQDCTTPAGVVTTCPIDASAYEGLIFWARSYDPSGAPTTKGFTLSIDDKNSHGGGYVPDASAATGFSDSGVCTNIDAGSLSNGAVITTVVNGSGLVGGGSVAAQLPSYACGNAFSYVMLTTEEWHLYTIPWSSFHQQAIPSRIPTGFDPSTFFSIRIAAPKEARMALWISKLGFYRHKQANEGFEAGSEGGP
ncbi:MAG: hypothetical protein WBY94_16705 [Polyangiaceae bacterium]